MSRANALLHEQSRQIMEWLDRITEMSEKAEDTDEDGRWGVDGWIQLIHDMIDWQIRSSATIVEGVIEGPWWLRRHETYEADYLRASKPKSYDRKYEIVKPFRRRGAEDDDIPEHLLEIDPPILRPGQMRFRITLKNSPESARFYGANYEGEILWKPVDAKVVPRGLPDYPQNFSVGL